LSNNKQIEPEWFDSVDLIAGGPMNFE
jgi:hypothetical protein